MGKSENNNSKFAKNIKRSYKKFKYLDKTQASYFVVTTFIAAFCMFTSVTYSYFTFSKHLNAATITIAKLNYVLESKTEGYKDDSITVPKGETLFVDLDLKSLNSARTRYALNYKTSTNGINVYYSENLKKNVSGVIGANGSVINMRVVLENTSSEDAVVTFNMAGGYLQNSLKSNIIKGYFEEDLTVRITLYDEYFENPTQVIEFPEKDEYSFYKVECSNGVTANFDTAKWILNRSDNSKQTSCDVYFKKATEPIEMYYNILGNNETNRISILKPDNNGLYKFISSTCSNDSKYTFDENTFEFKIESYKPNTLCVANFKTDQILENSDRFNIAFDPNGGNVKILDKTVINGGKYGTLPIPTYKEHIFKGWFTEITGGIEITSEMDVDPNNNRKLYAHWESASQVDVSINALDAVVNTDVFPIEDDYGTSYYYKGSSSNNYVKFLGNYFRVIRINGDGSVRMIYDGTMPHNNGEASNDRVLITNIKWNDEYANDAKYTGYMYGGDNGISSISKEQAQTNQTDSNVKKVLDEWYQKQIVNRGYESSIADSVFCNDRSTRDTELGYGNNVTTYNAYNRILNADGSFKANTISSLVCPNKNDAFTSRDTDKGNGTLYYPIGLITVDEAHLLSAYAGIDNYLYRGLTYWTMSPSKFDIESKMFVVDTESIDSKVNEGKAVVPVINLSAEYVSMMRGEGTKESPHMVK